MNKILVTNQLKYPKKPPKKGNVVVVHLLVALNVPLCEGLREAKTNPFAFFPRQRQKQKQQSVNKSFKKTEKKFLLDYSFIFLA